MKFEFANADLISGALAVVALLLTLSAALKLVSDIIATRIVDEIDDKDLIQLSPADLVPEPGKRSLFVERRHRLITITSVASFTIEALLPLCVGFAVSFYATQDMVELFKSIAN